MKKLFAFIILSLTSITYGNNKQELLLPGSPITIQRARLDQPHPLTANAPVVDNQLTSESFTPEANLNRIQRMRELSIAERVAQLPRSIRNAPNGLLARIREKIKNDEELTLDEELELQYRVHLDLMERMGSSTIPLTPER